MVVAKDLITKDFIKADISETVSKLIGKFKRKKHTHAVVFDKNKYIGVISKDFLLKSRIDPSVMKLSNIVKRRSRSKTNLFVPELDPKTDLLEIVRLMYTGDVKILPVISKDKFLGVVKILDVLKIISPEYKGIPIETIYSKKPATVHVDTPIGEVIKLFNRLKFHRVPVVDDKKEFLGMLTFSDLVRDYYVWTKDTLRVPNEAQHQGYKRSGYDMGEKVSQVNSPIRTMISYAPLYSVKPNATVAQAINVMVKGDVCSVVVVDIKKVVGILTARDVLKDYAKA